MRDFEKVKETSEVGLTGRGAGVIISVSLVLVLLAFGAGYFVGQQSVRPVLIQENDVWENVLGKDEQEKPTQYTFEKELREPNMIAPTKAPTVQTADFKEPPKTPSLEPTTSPIPALERPQKKRDKDGTKTVAKPKGYSLQIRAFRNIVEANEFVSTLRREGYTPHMILSDIPGRGRWYRVRVGRFGTMDEALRYQAVFEKKEGIATFVAPL